MTLKALYEVPAPAKLNLFLHVVGRRDDGYHLLQSVFVPIDWADTLHFERRGDGRLQRHDLGPTLPADDLSVRAATLLQRESGTPLGADIHVLKRVPWGAGLGGGSSDAATTLLALNRLWGLRWPRSRLLELATRLGADVPFFVAGTPAFVEGIGERLTPIELPPMRFAVVKPAASVSTPAVFGDPRLTRDTAPVILAGFLADIARDRGATSELFGRNDLEPVAEALCAEVGQARQWLAARFGPARMSGSGSAVFARIDEGDSSVATPGSEVFDTLPPGWTGRLTRSLPVHPLAHWAD
ncbi:4-(cytidine 5'-diphospho)-2-C-methyl-D-erythritol kinase [Azohydromonas sediminis]|uniref:4-(cytidine 5'-diphospho)-2-C-methyl-D-erythritol kinase n=1 Tax=Azohydromonas sediminis TaxID=2259674 RepID=UPI000E64B45A|nr:4-(cytidine 5'-diphospho)-2-C-methyl-D-erythritol kinase [Azohydromonas sediminis]